MFMSVHVCKLLTPLCTYILLHLFLICAHCIYFVQITRVYLSHHEKKYDEVKGITSITLSHGTARATQPPTQLLHPIGIRQILSKGNCLSQIPG